MVATVAATSESDVGNVARSLVWNFKLVLASSDNGAIA